MDEKQLELILSLPDEKAAEMLTDLRWTETETKDAVFDMMIKKAEAEENYELCDTLHGLRTNLDQLQERLEKDGKLTT